MLPRIAAVTMTYNEPDFAGLWAAHYGAEVGARNCFIVDHGSDDGSLDGLGGVNIVTNPALAAGRSCAARRFVSAFCASLLVWYDAVIHVDIDEILVADPALYPSLAHYAAADPRPVISAIGLDLLHVPQAVERPLSRGLPVCATAALAAVLECDVQAGADPPGGRLGAGLPLDRSAARVRRALPVPPALRRSRPRPGAAGQDPRTQPWQEAGRRRAPAHDGRGLGGDAAVDGGAGRVATPGRCSPGEAPLAPWLERVCQSAVGREGQTYRIDLHISGDELWRLPTRFRDRF